MIDKWLKAGVLEDGLLRHATEGSPQGGVISPCLSNIFLHHVLDEWFESEVRLWRVNLGETGGGDLDGMRRPIAGS
jgi:retron-type reverse transcriptase